MESLTRINKFIASHTEFARRKIDEFIIQGRVTINNITILDPGYKVNPISDRVALDGEKIKTSTRKTYIILNKPEKIITAVTDDKKRKTVTDLISIKNIFPVGRLDYDTTGLLLLTNDGEFANQMMNPKFKVEKTYEVTLSRELEEKIKEKLEKGIKIEGKRTLPCEIKYINRFDKAEVSVKISEGKNRQIRKMFEFYGYFVRKLHRSKYGKLTLKGLNIGEWRLLSGDELALMNFENKK